MGKRSKKERNRTRQSKLVVDKTPISTTKEVHDPERPVEYHQRTIRFSVGQHDVDGKWGWKGLCTHVFFTDLFSKILNDYQSMKYTELISPKNKSHAINIDDPGFSRDAIKRIQDLKLHERFDELISINITGKKRLWCTHDENDLHILWWDPKHEVYPSVKKSKKAAG